MYAPPNLFCAAAVGSLGRGQTHPIQWPASVTKTIAQSKADKLRGARVVCNWLDYARSSRTPLGYARLAG